MPVLPSCLLCSKQPLGPLSLSQRQLSTPSSTGFAKLPAVKRSFQLCAPVHHGWNPYHSHQLTLSRPSPLQSAVLIPTFTAAFTACAGVADVNPACRTRLSFGATALAAASQPVRRPDAPSAAERMDFFQQRICRSALDRFWQGRHSQARLELAGRQQVAYSRSRRRTHATSGSRCLPERQFHVYCCTAASQFRGHD